MISEGVAALADDVRRLLDGAVVRDIGRALDMGVAEFRGARNGEDLSTHLQCPFRILHDGHVVLGSRDMRYPQQGAGADAFDAFETVYDARAERLNGLLAERPPRVENVHVGEAGDLVMAWGSGFSLEVFPDCSGRIEAWRDLAAGVPTTATRSARSDPGTPPGEGRDQRTVRRSADCRDCGPGRGSTTTGDLTDRHHRRWVRRNEIDPGPDVVRTGVET